MRLGRIVTTRSGERPPDNTSGLVPVVGAGGATGTTEKSNVSTGSVLVGRVGTVGAVHLPKSAVWATDNTLVVTPVEGVDRRWVAYVLRATNLKDSSAGSGTAQPMITGSQLRDVVCEWTPLDGQRRIADFLDDRVDRIDRVIAARRKQIALLQDLRAEQLRLNVAGVFEDTSPTRSTSIGWSPRMHEEAEAVRLSRVVTLQRGVDLTEDQRQPGAAKVVTTAGVVGTHNESISRGPGVVIGRYGSVGNVHWVEGPHWPHNTTLYVRSTHGNNLRWVYYLLLAFPYEVLQARAAVPGVNRNDMATEMVPLLPLKLQAVAVGHLDSAADDFDKQSRSLERSIALLTKYKTSLITAAVTGELDVSTAGSNIPG